MKEAWSTVHNAGRKLTAGSMNELSDAITETVAGALNKIKF